MIHQQYKNIAFWVMLILVIALGIYLVHWTTTESFECVSNPYNYTLNLLKEANDAEVVCTCTPLKERGLTVQLTSEGFKKIED